MLKHVGSTNLSMIDSATQCNEIIVVEGVKPTGIEIGSGTYGRVFEVDYKGKLCVGKEVHKHMARSLDEETFLSFCQAWSAIRHPHIIQFLGLIAKYIDYFTLYIFNRSMLF